MSTNKVIIKPSFGGLELTPEFYHTIEGLGYESIYQLAARTDERLIKLVEEGSVTINDWEYLSVVEVDTSKQWFIDNYDGAESIKYLNYKIIDKDLNCIELT